MNHLKVVHSHSRHFCGSFRYFLACFQTGQGSAKMENWLLYLVGIGALNEVFRNCGSYTQVHRVQSSESHPSGLSTVAFWQAQQCHTSSFEFRDSLSSQIFETEAVFSSITITDLGALHFRSPGLKWWPYFNNSRKCFSIEPPAKDKGYTVLAKTFRSVEIFRVSYWKEKLVIDFHMLELNDNVFME